MGDRLWAVAKKQHHCPAQQSITGVTSKGSSLQQLASAKKSYQSSAREIMSIMKLTLTQTDKYLEFFVSTQKNFVLNTDDLRRPRHGWLDHADLEKEERSNQGGVAAYKAYFLDRMELIP